MPFLLLPYLPNWYVIYMRLLLDKRSNWSKGRLETLNGAKMSWRFISTTRRFERLALKAIRHQSVFVSLNSAERRQLDKLQRTPAVADLIQAFHEWCARPPKGFEKYFKDKPSTKSEPKQAEAAREAKVRWNKPWNWQSHPTMVDVCGVTYKGLLLKWGVKKSNTKQLTLCSWKFKKSHTKKHVPTSFNSRE